MFNRICRISLFMLALFFIPSLLSATTFYLDCNGGNDGNAGTTPSTAWKSLAKANATTFAPGDSLLLFTGCSWTGTLHPGGSGTAANVITLDQFGTGAMPRIDGGAAVTATVELSGQQYWDINNLEITNAGAAGLHRGVLIIATGTSHHIHLVGLNIHDVSGQLGADNTSKATGGIGFESHGGAGAKFDDVLVENCTVTHVDDVGLYTTSDSGTNPRAGSFATAAWTNVIIRGNHFTNIGKNTIIVRAANAPLIESNVINGSSTRLHGNAIFTIGTLNAVMQFNEVFGTAPNFTGLEGAAFDPDGDSQSTLVQYNYTHNNGGGLANPNDIPGGFSDGTIIRYNISQDDVHRVIEFSGACTNTQIYNNTIYIGAGLSPSIFGGHAFGGTGGLASNTTYSNNIIYNVGNGTYNVTGLANNVFNSNLFFGNHPASEPADPHKITADPMLVSPGSGGVGINTVDGYHLKAGSPAAGSGAVIANNGGRDFFGTALPSGAPDRGAAQGSSGPPPPDFSISASPSSQSINAGSMTTYTVSVTGSNGFSGTVTLGVSGLPSGASGFFTPASVSGTNSSTLTVTTSASTPGGTSTLTITGTSGTLSHSTTVTLIVGGVPAAPTLTGTAGNAQVNLSWTTSSAATSYNVKRSLMTGGPYSLLASGVTVTNFTDNTVTNGTTYFYVVSAQNAVGESPNSNEVKLTPTAFSIAINCGGPAISPFVADRDFAGGATINHANTIDTSKVTNPAPAAVYQTARIDNFTYTIPGFAAGSSHTVRLHFAETFFGTAGSRTFNVTINGTQVLTAFDIFKAAGGKNIANIQQFTGTANASGQFVIKFTSVVNNSLISGIEVQ
jgi:hypothetical protein